MNDTTTPNREQRRRKRAPERHVPRLASVAEAASFLDCHERTVYRLIRRGELRGYRVGRHLKVDMIQVYDYATPVAPESVAG
jgi:excisionase family DNA binding protein